MGSVEVVNTVLVASAQDRVHAACRLQLPETEFLLKESRSGVDCVNCLSGEPVDVLILDAALQWGGADGVLEILKDTVPARSQPTLVFLVATEVTADLLYRVSQFRVDDFQIGLHDRVNLGMRVRKLVRNRWGARQSLRQLPISKPQ